MAKPTKSGRRNARPAAKAGPGAKGAVGTGSGAAKGPSGDVARPLPRPSAREAAARAVGKAPTKGGAASGAKASPEKAGRAEDAKTAGAKPSGDKQPASVRRPPAPTKRTTPPASARYTPPIPKSEKVSPIWVPILMFACLGLGMLTIILNYVNVLPGKDPSNAYLMIGLALITVGFVTATKYH